MLCFVIIERLAVGAFFAISGAHKLFNPEVREGFRGMLKKLKVEHLWLVVASGEMFGGLGVFAGTLTPLACAGLIVILMGAIKLDVWETDVVEKHPKDASDWVAKTIYCPEVLLTLMLVQIAFSPDIFSIDQLLDKWGAGFLEFTGIAMS